MPVTDSERMGVLAVALKSLNCETSLDISVVGSMLPWAFSPADIQVLGTPPLAAIH